MRPETPAGIFPEKVSRPPASASLAARCLAEGTGTFFLLLAVVGSGISASRLSGGNAAITLLVNSFATGAALVAVILAFNQVSGGHFNPIVTAVEAWLEELTWREAALYVLAQIGGAFGGVAAAHVMFRMSAFSPSRHVRTGAPQWFAEVLATAGLIVIIRGASRLGTLPVAVAVGCYIAAAYWFTASTAFANPAVTLARSLTDSFSGIRPADAPAFVAAQLTGGALGGCLARRPARFSA